MPDCHGCSRKPVRGVEDVDVSETRVSAFKELTWMRIQTVNIKKYNSDVGKCHGKDKTI